MRWAVNVLYCIISHRVKTLCLFAGMDPDSEEDEKDLYLHDREVCTVHVVRSHSQA